MQEHQIGISLNEKQRNNLSLLKKQISFGPWWNILASLLCFICCFHNLAHSWPRVLHRCIALFSQSVPNRSTWGRVVKESESEVAQSCPNICGPRGCSLAGSSIHGIFQARVLDWVAISFCRGSSWPSTLCPCCYIQYIECPMRQMNPFWITWADTRSPLLASTPGGAIFNYSWLYFL